MMKLYSLLLAASIGLSACQSTTTTSTTAEKPKTPDVELAAGDYVWSNRGGCGTLTVGETLGYIWDKKCDGKVDFTAQTVRISGNTILIDRAGMYVREQTEKSFKGTWKLGSYTTEAEFVYQPS